MDEISCLECGRSQDDSVAMKVIRPQQQRGHTEAFWECWGPVPPAYAVHMEEVNHGAEVQQFYLK